MKITFREVFENAKTVKGISQHKVAMLMDWSAQQLSQRISNNTFKADEFFDMMDRMGFNVLFVNRDTGMVLRDVAGVGRGWKGLCNGVTFNKKKAQAIANTFYEDGENMYKNGEAQELYVDGQGRYFMVNYSEKGADYDKAMLVPSSVAAAFAEMYKKH